jgi:hypothetical protein
MKLDEGCDGGRFFAMLLMERGIVDRGAKIGLGKNREDVTVFAHGALPPRQSNMIGFE